MLTLLTRVCWEMIMMMKMTASSSSSSTRSDRNVKINDLRTEQSNKNRKEIYLGTAASLGKKRPSQNVACTWQRCSFVWLVLLSLKNARNSIFYAYPLHLTLGYARLNSNLLRINYVRHVVFTRQGPTSSFRPSPSRSSRSTAGSPSRTRIRAPKTWATVRPWP